MRLVVLKEIRPNEERVAMVPQVLGRFVKGGAKVTVEAGAGAGAFMPDAEYAAAGAEVSADVAAMLAEADVVVKVCPPTTDDSLGRCEVDLLRGGSVLVSLLDPLGSPERIERLAGRGVTSLALERIPRIARAQSMDVLSSMSTLAGYKAALMAADALRRIAPMMMTAAGTIRPAAAVVIGAGVAGLQAVATAKRLGAVVKAIDVRPGVKEQVESLGAKFIPMEVRHEAEGSGGYARDLGEAFYRREQEIIAPHLKDADMVITTALIPGRPAPVLITEAMVRSMKAGSVVVDLAAASGGNCALTEPDRRVRRHGVVILGPTNLPSELSVHASQMFSRNVGALLDELLDEGGQIRLDMDNEIVRAALVTHGGRVVHGPPGGAPEKAEAKG